MNQDNIINILQQTDLFADMDKKILAEMAAITYFKSLNKNELLIQEQSIASDIYIITRGAFSVSKKSDAKDNLVQAEFTLLKPFATVGELSFLDEKPRSADVIAQDDNCEVLAIPFAALKKIAPTSFYLKLSQKLSNNIRTGNDTIIQKLRQELKQNKRMANMGRFISYVLLLMAFYDLALKGFISLATNPYTSMFASTSVIFVFTVALTVMVKRMRLPLSSFGLNKVDWKQATIESLFFTSIFLLLLTGLKWVIIRNTTLHLIDLQAIVPAAKIGTSQFFIWYISGIVVYSVFSIFQEFITRGVLQSSLMHFLEGKHKNAVANIITSGVFSAMHIHLSTALAYAVFLPSLFWGWLYSRHRTLIGPIISHLLIGVWAIFVLGVQGLLS